MTPSEHTQTTLSLTITQNKTKKIILAALFAALAYVSIQSLHVAIFAPIGAPFSTSAMPSSHSLPSTWA